MFLAWVTPTWRWKGLTGGSLVNVEPSHVVGVYMVHLALRREYLILALGYSGLVATRRRRPGINRSLANRGSNPMSFIVLKVQSGSKNLIF